MPPRRLLEPSRLAPASVNLTRVFLVGIGCWLVALAATATLAATGNGSVHAVVTSAIGAVLGLLALLWARIWGPRS